MTPPRLANKCTLCGSKGQAVGLPRPGARGVEVGTQLRCLDEIVGMAKRYGDPQAPGAPSKLSGGQEASWT